MLTRAVSLMTRMMLLLICAFAGPLLAASQSTTNLINVGDGDIALKEFVMGYFVDPSQQMSLAEVQQQEFIPSGSSITLGTNAKTTWSRLDIHNTASHSRRLFVHHPHAYHLESIGFYETRQGELLNQADIHLDRDESHPMMFGGSAVFAFVIAPDEYKTIYIKNVTFSHQWYSLQLFDEAHSKRALVGSGNYIALLVGMMLALMIYNFFLYLSARKVENVVYALYLISGTIWVGLSYGVAANFLGIYSAAILQLNSNLLSMPSFLVLFMMLIFETRRRYPREHLALSLILTLLVADFIYSLFDVVGALKPASTLAAMMMVVTFGVSLSLWRKGEPLAKYFLLGHSMFIVFNMLAVFYYKGLSQANQINSHGVGIGILLEALMMAFILSYRIKTLEQLKAKQGELKRQANTDPMTHLFNRRYFDVTSPLLLTEAKATGAHWTLLIIDIDNFKTINDTYGHHVGDLVIIEFAAVLKQNQRPQDIACRFGGDEFVLLLNCNLENATRIAERIRAHAESLAVTIPEGQKLHFTVSIGVHAVLPGTDSMQEALQGADAALYESKRQGRNKVISRLNDSAA
ncbi:sensor domain-containing diguanylate cyclase [Shewanella zhangzhouensis]|uniref:sensor domain-containing diguanylate cyclase n=1 Tax=Shewanella zhangzhouensis TaxID=2864213 RepID=UPI001C656B72|nr:diguanylate cyclase [Shewanella zhangzhouensis]QYK04614.1 sensor domain-containing diguanylate cyclase [Shewanella zhangzhouensis]